MYAGPPGLRVTFMYKGSILCTTDPYTIRVNLILNFPFYNSSRGLSFASTILGNPSILVSGINSLGPGGDLIAITVIVYMYVLGLHQHFALILIALFVPCASLSIYTSPTFCAMSI